MTTQNMTQTTDVDAADRMKLLADAQHGVFGSWWQLAIGMGESTCAFGFGLAQDTRSELRRRADVTLTFAEDMGVGGFKFLRKVIDRVDHVTAESLGRSEAAILVVTRSLRKTGHGVTDLASTTLSDTIGSSQRKSDFTRPAASA